MDDFRCFLTLDPRYEICMIIFFNDFFVWILSTLNASYFVNNLFNDTTCFHTLDPNHVSHWSAFVFAYYSGVSCWDIGFGKDFSPSNCICLFYICVFVYQCILYLCLSTCLVIQVWASGETLGGLRGDFHCTALCTAPSTVGVFSALGAGTGSFTLLNNRVWKKSIPFLPFQFYIPKSPETTLMYLSFEPWHKEGLPNAGGAKELYGQ